MERNSLQGPFVLVLRESECPQLRLLSLHCHDVGQSLSTPIDLGCMGWVNWSPERKEEATVNCVSDTTSSILPRNRIDPTQQLNSHWSPQPSTEVWEETLEFYPVQQNKISIAKYIQLYTSFLERRAEYRLLCKLPLQLLVPVMKILYSI